MTFTKENLNSLYRYALSLTHKEEWAYDLVSDAVEKVWVRPLVLNKMAYAKKVIRHRFFDDKKKADFHNESIEEVIELESFENLESMTIQKNEVEKTLRILKPEERELLYLWAVEDYTLQEISSLTGTPRGTLTSRLSRLKAKIKEAEHERPH